MAIEGGALKVNITAIGPLVLPTWDKLLFLLRLPPAACLLMKLITAMKLPLFVLCADHRRRNVLAIGIKSMSPAMLHSIATAHAMV